jgi:transcriptional regulator with XRE-family HTH domain
MKPLLNRALKLVRVYHNLAQVEAAHLIGLSKSYISEIESGQKKVSLEVLEKYSEAFKIPVSSLMLFAEHAKGSRLSEDARVYIAEKALKMLDWIATITDPHEAEGGTSWSNESHTRPISPRSTK